MDLRLRPVRGGVEVAPAVVLDCNGHEVPDGIVAISQIAEVEPAETWRQVRPTGLIEYYIDRKPVTQAEYDRAIEDFRRRGR